MNRLYLLDGSAICAWQHFAVSDHSDHSDASEGIRLWWSEFSKRYQPELAVAALDCSRESNWRKKLFAEYKSGRDSLPPDPGLRDAMRALPETIASIGVPIARYDEFEADDVIATLAARHRGEVIIVTSDKDMHQLVTDRVRVYDPRPDKQGVCHFYDETAVFEKHHVPANRVRELLAIQGDASDSIPGVEGWGKVAAVNAIKQTRSRMELLRLAREGKLKDITPKKQASFIKQLEAFELSYKLVGLRFDAPVPENFNMAITPNQEAA